MSTDSGIHSCDMDKQITTHSKIPSPGVSASRKTGLWFSSRAGTMSNTLRMELKVINRDSFAKSSPGQMLDNVLHFGLLTVTSPGELSTKVKSM